MNAGNGEYGELEIGLRRAQPEAIEVELRVNDPATQGELAPACGQINITPEKLLEELFARQNDPDEYGKVLAGYIFQDQAIRERFSETKASFESRAMPIRLRIQIAPSLPELHGVCWELLRDPKTGGTLATSERIVFSRFILSQDWRVIKLRPKSELKALIAVASPTDLAEHKLAAVSVELERARESLAGIQATTMGDQEPLTLNRLIEAIRQGVDILYLVCHGEISRKMIPQLLLQNEDGTTDKIEAGKFAERIHELMEVPRLVVLASCESAGTELGDRGCAAQIALAPRLAEAGVPSVLAMQGNISMETVKRVMPTFFAELLKDGQIDRAMAVARGVVRDRVDAWIPALFLRLKDGRIWGEPGVAEKRMFNLPLARNRFFTGRDDILENIHRGFHSGEPVQAISGLAGVGKTQTAVEFAYRNQHLYRVVLWGKAHTRESLVTDYVAMAALLGLPEQNAQDQREAVAAVKRWLAGNPGWLLILDNADELGMAGEFLPPQYGGHILLTTRASYAGDIAVRNVVNKMQLAEGATFLLRKTGKLKNDEPLESAPAELRAQAVALSKELDGLPLALDQAAAFIGEMQSSIAEYLSLYETERATLLAHRGGLTQDHPSVTVTFSLAFKQVEQASAAAADVLRVCAFLQPDAIPLEIFSDGGQELGERLSGIADSPLQLTKAIAEAGRFSLLQSEPETNTVSLHRLVQEVLIAEMDDEVCKLWAERAVRATNTASRLLNQRADYLVEHAQYKKAELLMRRAIAIDEWSLGFDHPDVGRDLNNLAQLLKATNRLSEVEPLMRRALEIDERSYGPDHPDVGIDLNNLAQLLQATNRLSEAEPLMRRALAIDERSYGPDHPNVGIRLNNLARLLQATSRLSEAEPLMRRAVAIFETSLGPEHPNTIIVMENYAGLLRAMKRKVGGTD